MNFYFCNRYDSKNEDIYIITPNIKKKIKKYHKKENFTNLLLEQSPLKELE